MFMRYLVTGGAGFIGSHITKALLTRGDSVRIFDNFSTGLRERIHEGAEVIEGDIRNFDAMAKACDGFDGIFHTAALPRVQYSIENPHETNEVNVIGTLNVLIAARDAGVKRVVYSASSSAYGDPISLPLREDMQPNPKSPYGLQKFVGEEYCKQASLFWGVETVSPRYFNVYGPNMAFEGAYVTVIPVFLRQRAEGTPLTITGDGTQTRDFTYVGDVVRANLLAMESGKVGKGEVINIGNGDNKSVNEIAAYFNHPIVNIPPRVEPHDTLACRTRAKELLNWEPEIDFKEGMRRTFEWFKETH